MPEQLTSDTTSPTSAIPIPSLEELNQHYTVRNHNTVALFLERHPELISPLLGAFIRIQSLFPGVQLFLDVDMEDGPSGQHQQLVAVIVADVDAHEAVARLRTFDFEWWLAQPSSKSGLLLFTVE